MPKKIQVSYRIREDLVDGLKAASTAGNFPPSQTFIVERGIELALEELKKGGKK